MDMDVYELIDNYYIDLVSIKFKSAKSYRSYLEYIFDYVPGGNVLLEIIARETVVDKQLFYCYLLLTCVQIEKGKQNTKKDKKRIQNWASSVTKLIELLNKKGGFASTKSPVQKTKKKKWDDVKILLPLTGKDDNSENIRYADDVMEDEKVPGICNLLEQEYDRILQFAQNVLSNRFSQFLCKIPVVLNKKTPFRSF